MGVRLKQLARDGATDGQFVMWDSVAGEYVSGFPTVGDHASVQARRATDLAAPAAFADVTLDVTDVENNAAVIEHDNINTDRIVVKETGLYIISYTAQIHSTGSDIVNIRVRINDTVVLPGSESSFGTNTHNNDHENHVALTTPVELTADDFLSLQIQGTTAGSNLLAGACLTIIRASGPQGPQGPQGPGGTDDTAIHDNVAGEIALIPEKATPVADDLLVIEDSADSNNKKRVQVGNLPGVGGGGAQKSMDFVMGDTGLDRVETNSSTYVLARSFIFRGTTTMGTPTNIKAISYGDPGSTSAVRIFDLTNSLVIAEKTGIVDSVATIQDLGILSNLPTGEAIWEIQFRRTTGSGPDRACLASVQVQF